MTLTSPKDSVTPSVSRRSSRRSISVSVSFLGCVYQSPSKGATSARRALEVELAHLVGAPEVQVDRALVDGRVARARPRRVPSSSPCGDVDDRERCPARPSAARRARPGSPPGVRRTKPPARARRSSPGADQALGVRAPRAARGSRRRGPDERPLVRGAEQVRAVDLLVLVVEDRRLDGAVEELVGVAAEELVERVLAGDVDGQPAAAAARAAPHLAQRGDRAGERHDDRRVERADVDAELERVGRDDGAAARRAISRASSSRRCCGV